jgi:hypothetical protein
MEAENKHREIAKIAYSIYEKRVKNGKNGDSTTDWVEAEQKWQQKTRKKAAAN